MDKAHICVPLSKVNLDTVLISVFQEAMTHIAYRSGPNIQLQLCPGGEGGRRGGGGEEAQVQHEPLPERGRGPSRPPGDGDDDDDDDDDNDNHLQSIQSLVANMTFSAD